MRDPPVPVTAMVVNVNMDMVGRDPGNKLFAVGIHQYPFLKPYVEAAVQPPVVLAFGHDIPGHLTEGPEQDWTADSDHYVFHQAGIPFVYFGVEDFDQHHKATDDSPTTIGNSLPEPRRRRSPPSASSMPISSRSPLHERPGRPAASMIARSVHVILRSWRSTGRATVCTCGARHRRRAGGSERRSLPRRTERTIGRRPAAQIERVPDRRPRTRPPRDPETPPDAVAGPTLTLDLHGKTAAEAVDASTAFSVMRCSRVPSKPASSTAGAAARSKTRCMFACDNCLRFAASDWTRGTPESPSSGSDPHRSGAHGAAERRRTIYSKLPESRNKDAETLDGHRAGCRAERERGRGACRGADRTVINAPPNSAIDVVLNATPVASGAADAAGAATLKTKMQEAIGKAEIDANVFVDYCGERRRVLIVEVGAPSAPVDAGCDRRQISGLYWVRPVNTVVVNLAGLAPTLLLIKGSYDIPAPNVDGTTRPRNPTPIRGPSHRRDWSSSAARGCRKSAMHLPTACGNVSPCSGDDSGFGTPAGAAYWITRFLGRRGDVCQTEEHDSEGGDIFRFNSTLDPDVWTLAGVVLAARPDTTLRQGGDGLSPGDVDDGRNHQRCDADTRVQNERVRLGLRRRARSVGEQPRRALWRKWTSAG